MTSIKTLMTAGLVFCLGYHENATADSGFAPAVQEHAANRKQGSRIFISGHSLTADFFGRYLANISEARGHQLEWDSHLVAGSSLRDRFLSASRAEGKGPKADNPVLAANGKPYDILILTEQHRLLDSIVWQDMLRYLKAYQDRYVAANPDGKTYFFTPWISVSDPEDPLGWVSYEAEAMPIWRCAISQVNKEIEQAGRDDRIVLLPTSLALADLVKRLWEEPQLRGFETVDRRSRLSMIFSDDVHLTPLGAIYIAAVTSSLIYGEGTGQVWVPDEVDRLRAETVLKIADEYLRNASAEENVSACQGRISPIFIARYMSYTEQTYYRRQLGLFRSKLRQYQEFLRFSWLLRNVFK